MGTPRHIFITGASAGIGAALARQYAASATSLGLVARRKDELEALAQQLPTRCLIYPLDVTDAAALSQAAADYIAAAAVPDIVIANAGVSVGTLTEAPEDLDKIKRVMEVNVLGVVHSFHPFVTPMRQAGKGTLVAIASVAGLRGLPGAGAYSASKAAVIAYLESLRVELRGSGVRVVTIAPGYIKTAMTAVNTHAMPFLMASDAAARSMVRAIHRGSRFSVMPWQMAIVAAIMKVLPRAWFDAIASRTGRKPRSDLH